nr:hypothetical protein [Tanacetum cinerariifolium]
MARNTGNGQEKKKTWILTRQYGVTSMIVLRRNIFMARRVSIQHYGVTIHKGNWDRRKHMADLNCEIRAKHWLRFHFHVEKRLGFLQEVDFLILPSNWFPLTRVKWLPLIANPFAVSKMVVRFYDRMEFSCFVDEVFDSRQETDKSGIEEALAALDITPKIKQEEIVYRITKVVKETHLTPNGKKVHWCKAILQKKENLHQYWASCDPYSDVCDGEGLLDNKEKRYWESMNDSE